MTGDKKTVESAEQEDKKTVDKTTKPEKSGQQSETDKSKTASNSTASKSTQAAAHKEQPKEKPKQQPKAKSSVLGKLLLFIWILLIAGIAAGGYFAWQFWQDYTAQQDQRFKALELEATNQQSKVSTLSNQQRGQLSDQSQLLENLQKEQTILQQRLDSHTQRLRALAGTSRDDWLLAEAKYLLRLATQRLLVERSTESVIGLLQAADKILLSVDDSGVLPVREAIAKEIIALKLAKTVDRQGVYLQLSALKSQIQALPLIPARPFQKNPANDKSEINHKSTIDEEKTETWYQSIWGSIKKAFGGLGRFVQIRHHDQTPDLLNSEQQQLQTINNLMLMFEQAQFALLHEDELIYRESMNKALNWWRAYYSHYPEYEVILSEIKRLASIAVVQEMPNITRSTELLTDYIEQFHKLTAPQPLKPKNKAAVQQKLDQNPPQPLPQNENSQQAVEKQNEGPQT
jgi:uroporphyrin-3 C-methyltransferase